MYEGAHTKAKRNPECARMRNSWRRYAHRKVEPFLAHINARFEHLEREPRCCGGPESVIFAQVCIVYHPRSILSGYARSAGLTICFCREHGSAIKAITEERDDSILNNPGCSADRRFFFAGSVPPLGRCQEQMHSITRELRIEGRSTFFVDVITQHDAASSNGTKVMLLSVWARACKKNIALMKT